MLTNTRLIDLSVPLEHAAVSEPLPPRIHYVTHAEEGLQQMQQFFGLINLLATRLSKLEPGELEELRLLFE